MELWSEQTGRWVCIGIITASLFTIAYNLMTVVT